MQGALEGTGFQDWVLLTTDYGLLSVDYCFSGSYSVPYIF